MFNITKYLSRCGTYVFSQTQLINHINDKNFVVESYSNSSTCHSISNSLIDAVPWHNGNDHHCYALALPISVSFVTVNKTNSWVLARTKNINCVEVQNSECYQVDKNLWLHDYSHCFDESESFTGVNLFTNPYALYSPEYVLSLCQVSAGTVNTNLLDLASKLVCTNIGQGIGTCEQQFQASRSFESYEFNCSGPGIGPHNSCSQVLIVKYCSYDSGLEHMHYSCCSASYFSFNHSFILYDKHYDTAYNNSSAMDVSSHSILEMDTLVERGETWPWCGLLAVNLVLHQVIYQSSFLLPNLMLYNYKYGKGS